MDVINIFILQFIKEKRLKLALFYRVIPLFNTPVYRSTSPTVQKYDIFIWLNQLSFCLKPRSGVRIYIHLLYSGCLSAYKSRFFSLNVWCTCNVYPTYCFIININRLGLLIIFWQHSSYSTTAKYGGGSYIWPWFTEMLTQKVKKT